LKDIGILGYEPFVKEIKDLIYKKQYQVLKLINAETEDREIIGVIISVGRGGCYALYFMMENRGEEWYNQKVKDMDKSWFERIYCERK